jgi:glycosyltransferase 2 family protein
VLLGLLAFTALALADNWQELRPLFGRLPPAAVGLALVAGLAGMFCSFRGWLAALSGLGSPLPFGGAMRVFFLGQLGKYVPGSVWSVLAQVELARGYGVPRSTSGAAMVVATLVTLVTGLGVAGAGLPLLGSDAVGRYAATLLALPVAALLLWPPMLNRLISWALRLARRAPLPVALDLGTVLRVAGWALAVWGCYGLHLWVLALGLGPGGATLLVEATAAFACAWCIGFLVFLAPAGAGAREAALVFLLQPTLPPSAATVLALTSRLVVTVADLVGGLVAVIAERRRRPGRRPTGLEGAVPSPTGADPGRASLDR